MQDKFNPKDFEQRLYARWTEEGAFTPKVDKTKKRFSIVLPPPNITGQLHLGHAMNTTIPDSIVRYKRMKGFSTLWLPGYDHASIATEAKVVEAMRAEGVTKEQVGREGFLKRAVEWKDNYGGRIIDQLKKLGLSLDWSRFSYTMDSRCSIAVRENFVRLYNEGYIYRGDRIINWCPHCQTAISDAEVEYIEEPSHLWHLKYPYADGSGYIVVATTRPETMLGDTAVAVNPSDSRYKGMEGKLIKLPLTDRTIPIVYDSYVEKEFGTGAVKITPAHDPNDFEVGLRHKLEVIRVMDDSGIMNDNAYAYKGMTREKAREAIVNDLDKLGLLYKTEDYTHNVGHCYRCHTTIEPIVSKQWFVAMKELAAPAIDIVKKGGIRFVPKRYEKQYFNWMNNIRDWCISRQLWWGHRIPVFYCDTCNEMTVSLTDIDTCPHCGAKVRQDEDVLDTWFSSALWPFATMGWPNETTDLDYFYPTDVLVTAYDIITFWVSRMIVMGLKQTNKPPFKNVFIHGLVRDEKGRKMSKSSGNGVDPLKLIDEVGADALRFALVNGIAVSGDICFSNEALINYRNFMNKLFNASRFVMNAISRAGVTKVEKPSAKNLTDVDKWLYVRLNDITAKVSRAFDKYDVGRAASTLYDFIWDEFCDKYIEYAKVQLKDEKRTVSTAQVLLDALVRVLKLVHPIIPFITTEIYDNLPDRKGELMLLEYPTRERLSYGDAPRRVERLNEAVRAVRNLKHTNSAIGSRPEVYAVGEDTSLIEYYLSALAGTQSVTVTDKPPKNAALLALEGVKLYLPIEDASADLSRLNADLAKAEKELALAQSKLANAGFIAKAPPSLVRGEEDKVKKYTDLIASIKAEILAKNS